MKLKTATFIFLLGSIGLLISYTYSIVLNYEVHKFKVLYDELVLGDYSYYSSYINLVWVLTLINFLISFLKAQRKRGSN